MSRRVWNANIAAAFSRGFNECRNTFADIPDGTDRYRFPGYIIHDGIDGANEMTSKNILNLITNIKEWTSDDLFDAYEVIEDEVFRRTQEGTIKP